VPNRNHLVEGIARALRASVGVFLALLIVNFILAVGASILFGRLAPEYFGDPLMSIYSTFRIFTVEGWHEIPELLAERAQNPGMAALARLYFAATVLSGGILGFSLANAVFVDQMMMDNTEELEAKVDELRLKVDGIGAEIRAVREALEAGQGRDDSAGDG
jgi:voltage-gated sodium channel